MTQWKERHAQASDSGPAARQRNTRSSLHHGGIAREGERMKRTILALGVTLSLGLASHALAQVITFALDFEGVDDFVDFGDTSDLEGMDEITIEAWVKTTAGGTVLSKFTHLQNGSLDDSYNLSINLPGQDGFIRWQLDTDSGNGIIDDNILLVASPARTDEWHHLAATYDGATMRVLVDGELVGGTLAATGPINTNDTPLYIARSFVTGEPAHFFDGLIHEVRVWDRARSECEIAADMNATLTGRENGLIAYWPMDEGVGQEVADRAGMNHGHLGATADPDTDDPVWTKIIFPHQTLLCPWDLDCDGMVGIMDLLDLLAVWGTNTGSPPDFDGDGNVGIVDFLLLLANWGACP